MIPDRSWFVIQVAARSVKLVYQEVLLPITGHEHEHCCVRTVENLNTAASSHPQRTKRYMQEEAILINTPGAFAPFLLVQN